MKYQLTLTTTNKNRWHILFNAVNSIKYKAQRFNTIHMIYTNNQRIYTKNVSNIPILTLCVRVSGLMVRVWERKRKGKCIVLPQRGGLRECLTIPSTNSNVNRVRVHPLLASETNEGYTFILHGSGKHPLQGYSASAPDVPAS